MVLGVAMLVPALLAGGLMMAEVAGYDLAVSGGASAEPERRKAFGDGVPVAAAPPGASGAPVAIGAAQGDPAGAPPGGAMTGDTVIRGTVTDSEPVGNRATEPRLVPPPLRPYRVYDGWMPPDLIGLSYSRPMHRSGEAGEAGEAAETADRRRKRRVSGGGGKETPRTAHGPGTAHTQEPVESSGQETPDRSPTPSPTPSPVPPAEEAAAGTEAECSQEWRDTWLWEICLDGNRQKV
ncbi:hypothetical protein PS9374_05955 [Planomonospora sphaerica]|uniref:Uncharacterized protein n=1 Tax=Planomonospora sphaerica TaxID=161355 RepID=A0A161LLB8_9ACTN|nr:hypothetical protein [Planomonospora sphaerica]GAT70274.1 hypothetical protein PS9374_05955 [Planomonospora sphaerica]